METKRQRATENVVSLGGRWLGDNWERHRRQAMMVTPVNEEPHVRLERRSPMVDRVLLLGTSLEEGGRNGG